MRHSAEEARRTRDRIVAAGVARASTDGLHGLTIGSLAEELGMSKAGVVGPFGSRVDLQSAVLSRAVDLFTRAVAAPSLNAEAGLPRLRVVIDLWCRYLDGGPFPNGCFVTAASCELDGRPGELRESIHDAVTRWRAFLRDQVTAAQAAGDVPADRDADDLVTVLTGIAMAANQELQLLDDGRAPARARRLMLAAVAGGRGGEAS
ncbi:TetR/AcrR family transcriptional regulator [Actinomadura kijaniata]|uniref:AcrR family transcriptional regulator n=1 Tax=Actinomadura namibiensis TaxID=182080 RepID=A0A7W3LIB3_ACTNM|nr:TetR/AcrR family transcriptional regulator [Actinomadura namibiensis]MBA8948587.1 AcrR family transcriptional regulator [Actinomadura namibiensis]